MQESRSRENASACALLMPAGSGTLVASAALRQHHSHHLLVPAPCYLLLLRAPDERLESGVRYEIMEPRHGRRRLTQHFHNATAFVRALRRGDARAAHVWRRSQSKRDPGDDGSFFLTPAVFYLDRVAPAPVAMLCHRRLGAELEARVPRLDAGLEASVPHAYHRNERRARASPGVMARSTLDAEGRAWFRSLCARDVALVDRWCRRR